MATIKGFTTLEQSRKLAEILPIESADYFHAPDAGIVVTEPYKLNEDDETVITAYKGAIPCWSLSALLDVLPNNENISTNLSKGGYRISTLEYTNSWFVDYEDETNGLNNCVTSADNPVDACYEMVLKLHELKML